MAYITPKDTREIQNKFVTWLEANLIDPYEVAKSPETRPHFVYGDDFELVANFPKVHVDCADFTPNKISTQSKSTYLEEEEHHFMIYYYNQQGHRYTFADNNLTLTNAAQCRKYLQYIKDTMKSNITEFNDYGHRITFGTIPKPTRSPQASVWVSVLPVTVITYRR